MRFQNIVLLVLLVTAKTTWATIKLPAIFSDNMVLQRDLPIPLWGWAESGEQVQLVFKNKTYKTTTSADGKWTIRLDKCAAGGPYEMILTGPNNRVLIKNILVGDVWVASGQSNMERGMQTEVMNGYKINPNDQQIRFFYVPMSQSLQLKQDIDMSSKVTLNGKWIVCSPEVMKTEWAWHGFSAIGYYFATEIRRTAMVPVGMIGTYKGGTPAQAWMGMGNGDRYNAMVNPIVSYGIKGVLWYQGESNGDRLDDALNYEKLFPQLIQNWREKWGQGNFPFLWVQLANFRNEAKTPSEGNWPWVREAQSKALSLPQTGMAVAIDIGDAKDIHPKNKIDVGLRLALAARHLVYKEDVAYSGPVYQSMKIRDGKVYLRFKNIGKGLRSSHDDTSMQDKDMVPKILKGFGIAGADRKFVWANARIENNQVVLFNESISKPVAVRYNWADNPEGTLYNADRLPAGPFRTDDWPPK